MRQKLNLFNLAFAFALGFMIFGGVGAFVASAIALIPSGSGGALMAGIVPEVWTGEMVKAFRHDDTATFLDGIPDFSQYVKDGSVIHLIDFGCDPDVLINNTTYPISTHEMSNGDIALSLDKYQTQATRISDDTLNAVKVDMIQPVIEGHKIKIAESKYDKAIHSLAPAESTTKTPVLLTTGEIVNGRRRATRADIIVLKKKFDANKIPVKGRRLVLCADHVSDLLMADQKFAEQYYNYTSGKIANMYGFEIHEYVNNPFFTQGRTKVAFATTPTITDTQASVAFHVQSCAKATGDTRFYQSEAKTSPTTQENLVNFRHYFMALPKKQLAIAAIVSKFVATAWATAKQYKTGDFVYESNKIYVALSDHTSAATFAADAAKWSESVE